MNMNTGSRPLAVVIGAGFGGLAAAIRLAAQGYGVTVLEKRDKPGGRAYVLEKNGYTFDMGPTVVTAPHLLEELFQLSGKKMSDHVDMRSINPLYAVRFDDGTAFDYTGSRNTMSSQIRKLAPADLEGYRAFLKISEKIFHVGFECLSEEPFHSLGSMLRISPTMIQLQSYRSVYGLISRYIKNEKLRQLLSFHTLLVGGNPFHTTSVYALIAYVEEKWGVHFPMGGVGKLVNTLADLAISNGSHFRYNSEVTRIMVNDHRATGVQLSCGEIIPADVVVSNADVAWTFKKLIDPDVRRRWTDRKVDRLKYSMSLFVWYFGTRKRYEHIQQHSILLGPRYKGLLNDIFKHKVLADDFSLYLHRPTATDPSLAPAGHDAFYVLSPVPNLESDIDWQKRAEPYRASIQAYLEKTILPGLSDSLDVSCIMTPENFRDDLLSVHGAAFSIQPTLTQSAYFRPHNQNEDVENLYMVGAGTHPGAGLPGVLCSAAIMSKLVRKVNGAVQI